MQDWKIDKHVPVAVILAIILQTFGAVWWAASVSERMDNMEQNNLSHETRLRVIENDTPVIREKIQNIEKSTDRIEKKLDKLSATWPHKTAGIQPLVMLSFAELGKVKVS